MNRIVPMLIAVLLMMIGTTLAFIVARAPDPTAGQGPRLNYTEEGLNAVAWVQTAGEYEATARQAYAIAALMLDRALADASWTASLEQAASGGYEALPPAVILDVDETVLDNSANQVRQVLDDRDFATPSWQEWVREEKAGVVPGALSFTRQAAARSVRVFYVTNRRQEVEDATRRNLQHHGFPLVPDVDTILTRDERGDWGSDKGTRRQVVGGDHRILLLIGDALGDFVSGDDVAAELRKEMVRQHAEYWGSRWIVLPNPQYGAWDGALIGFDFGLSRDAKRAMKRAALNPAR
ncbi:MAG TPA: HAD family acid phosphatase [Acidobacteriota bacterium]|nr:HAD family acid phosphatase [Acidobacteriota bacterium]